ncbi:Nuclear pore complex protein [Sesamum angolense]|uniref:Nuclear pore complex protein n=1 Tax=Sesamum angolense TaxID=2727404 RepID=A0AAE1WLB4_9LAMI|nr:Nuclear pore complex protein [Sesamum angolense]
MLSHDSPPFAKESSKSPLHHSSRKTVRKMNTPHIRKTPLALIEYHPGSFSSNSPGAILMAQQNKSLHLTAPKSEGFLLDLKDKTPVTGSHSRNIVDAALFMGRSFRVGWGPNGMLVHSGMPVGSADSGIVLSSVINVEKVAIDKVTRDESNKVRAELTDLCFSSPLNLHKDLIHETKKLELGTFGLKLQKLVCNRLTLPDICRRYIDIIERQLEVPTLSSASRILLMHQVLVWELINLFSSRKMGGQVKPVEDEEEDIYQMGGKVIQMLTRKHFHLLGEQNSVIGCKRVFTILDAAVELAASRGDVRLSCLLSEAGGSPANRADLAHQLDLWRKNGLDFSFIEEERVRLLELLAGNIHGALQGVKIDWKSCSVLGNVIGPSMCWRTQESQWEFIENLGIPSAWLHEALQYGVFDDDYYPEFFSWVSHPPPLSPTPMCRQSIFSYSGDLPKALDHFLECGNWQRAHSIFMISVAHSLFLSGKHSEIWRLTTSMEDYKSEIEDWDLGAGIYISFYLLRSSMQEDSNTMTELDTLENKNDACSDFISRLNKSLAVWSSKLSVDARVVYSKMAEEICSLLLSDSGEGSTGEAQLNCFDTVFRAYARGPPVIPFAGCCLTFYMLSFGDSTVIPFSYICHLLIEFCNYGMLLFGSDLRY